MLMYRWRWEGIGRGPLSAAKRNVEAGSSGLWIFEEAASASSSSSLSLSSRWRWRVWVEKEPSKEFRDVLRMGKGKARQGQPGKSVTPKV
jgi:hypothetical protein